MPVTASNPFKWRHYPGDIILWCVRWYLRFPISFAHMAEMALERERTNLALGFDGWDDSPPRAPNEVES